MKKLLTVSLVALMSVTAANAADELAAKTYVDGAYNAATQYTDTQIGDLGTSTDVVDYVTDQLAGVTGGTITDANGQATTVSGAIAELQDEVELKANAADVYTKTDADAAFDAAGSAAQALTDAKTFAQNGANLTAGTVAKTALSTEVQASLDKADTALQAADIADKADKADTLAGYGITDAYTKTEADAAFDESGAAAQALTDAKAFAQNGANLTAGTVAKTALSTEVQASLGKADSALQAADIANKADKADTLAGYGITDAYTKTEADAAFTTSDEVNALIEEDYCPAGQARVGNACVTVVTTFTAPASL